MCSLQSRWKLVVAQMFSSLGSAQETGQDRTDVSSVKLAKANFVVNTNNGRQVLVMDRVISAVNTIPLWVI